MKDVISETTQNRVGTCTSKGLICLVAANHQIVASSSVELTWNICLILDDVIASFPEYLKQRRLVPRPFDTIDLNLTTDCRTVISSGSFVPWTSMIPPETST